MKHSTVSHYFRGANDPKALFFLYLAKVLDTPVQGFIPPASGVAEEIILSDDEFVRIPSRDVSQSAGPGSTAGKEETIGHLTFRAD